MLWAWDHACQTISVSPQICNGWFGTQAVGVARKELSICHIRDCHRHPGQCGLSLKGESPRESHPPAAESSYSLQIFKQKSPADTQSALHSENTQTSRNHVSSLDGSHKYNSQNSFQLLSPHIITLEFWLLPTYLKMSLSSQSSYETLAAETTQRQFHVFSWSDLTFCISFISTNIGWISTMR